MGSSTGLAGTDAGPLVPIGDSGYYYAPWPPPYMLVFAGYEGDLTSCAATPYGIAVDDKYVYWKTGAITCRIAKSGEGKPIAFKDGYVDLFDIVASHGYVYELAGAEVWRFDRESLDAPHTALPLAWSHDSGGIFADDKYVYAVMPGCAAITRFDQQTLEREIMYIDGVAAPSGPGYTRLAEVGDKLVCGSPSDIYVIDVWNTPARHVFTGANVLLGVTPWQDTIFWMQRGDDLGPNTPGVGYVPLAGGDGTIIHTDIGYSNHLAIVQSIAKLATGYADGLLVFDIKAKLESKRIPLNPARLSFTVNDLATDDAFIYMAIFGTAPRNIDGGALRNTRAYWIARVPFTELQ